MTGNERKMLDAQEAPDNQSGLAQSEAETHFLVVGMGASAGGLEALQVFFRNVPANSGMAFIVITHQHPNHPSMLADLIAREACIPVLPAEDNIPLRPDHVYVAMQGSQLAIFKGVLQHVDSAAGVSPSLPIDYFFRSLADDQGCNTVGIVLSGTGCDGSIGITALKAAGGLIVAQDIASANYTGMPASAIATGIVDFQLNPAAMPEQLILYARSGHLQNVTFLSRESTIPENAIYKILTLVRGRTGHDFSDYKSNTLIRRIERRMGLHQILCFTDYMRHLNEYPQEIDHLFKDMLIGVTSFFRDPEAWEALAPFLDELISRESPKNELRVWVAGCTTGEEAYSIAILLRERMDHVGKHVNTQIFATDIDGSALAKARAGRYPEGIAADVTQQRLQNYFTRNEDYYSIRGGIREMVLFAEHNLIGDPPFTRIDLVLCRNLLIYMNADLQSKLQPVFHYALRENGFLFLGSSETTDHQQEYFTPVDRHRKIYRRMPQVTSLPSVLPALVSLPQRPTPQKPPTNTNVSTLVEGALLSLFAPAAIVINDRGEIIHIHGHTGAYLEPAPGTPRHHILDMAREGLRSELAAAIRKVSSNGTAVVRDGLQVQGSHGVTMVDMSVQRLEKPEAMNGLLLVALRPAEKTRKKVRTIKTTHVSELADLENELSYLRESHRLTLEELETFNEELRASNEELQSTNEELQSTNEELETSKEELQSLNEELTTVNSELQSKLEEFSKVNDDMLNLLNSTDIATLFLDINLNIKRYTNQVQTLFHLRAGDLGRPIKEMASELTYTHLLADCHEVLDTLVMKEIEVAENNGNAYLMRIMPYRTAHNVIAGLVLLFIDITQMEKTRKSLNAMFRLFMATQHPVLVINQDNLVVDLNEPALEKWRAPRAAILGQSMLDFVLPEQVDAMKSDLESCRKGDPIMQKQYRLAGQDDKYFDATLDLTLVADVDGKTELVAINVAVVPDHER